MTPMMATITVARHNVSVSRTARLDSGSSDDPAEKERDGHERNNPGSDEPDRRRDRMAGPRQGERQLIERHEQRGKADRQAEPECPLLLNVVQEFVHAVASSRSENSSTGPMPRTSALVAEPKGTRSRTRS